MSKFSFRHVGARNVGVNQESVPAWKPREENVSKRKMWPMVVSATERLSKRRDVSDM